VEIATATVLKIVVLVPKIVVVLEVKLARIILVLIHIVAMGHAIVALAKILLRAV